MPLPLIAAQAGLTAAGALLGKKKKVALPDYTGLINTLNQAGSEQRGLITGVRPQTTALGKQYGQDVGNLASRLESKTAGLGTSYVNAAGDVNNEAATAALNRAKSNLLSVQPELTQNTREALAASGNLRGGALLESLTKQNQTLGTNLANVNSDIAQQTLANKADALKSAFSANAGAVTAATGLNADAFARLLASGREDLINEAANLVQESQNRTGQIVGLQSNGINNKFAADAARSSNQSDLINTLVGAGSNAIGQIGQNQQYQDLLRKLGLSK